MPDEAPILLRIATPFPVGPVNVFLIKGELLTLVDTGVRSEESLAVLEAGLKEQGVALRDLERVLLTHHHTDHMGLLAHIMAESGAESWGHPDLVEQSDLAHAHDDAHQQFFLEIMEEFGVPAETREQAMRLWDSYSEFTEPFTLTHPFTDAGKAGPFTTHFVPGHSATDTVLVHESAGYSLVGDHLLQLFNPNPLLRRPAPGQARPRALMEFRDSLERSHALTLGICYPGHGAPFPDHRRVIEGIQRQHERKNARILAMAQEGDITPHAVVGRLFPRLEVQHLYLGLSVAVGHLELLEAEGLLRRTLRDGVAHYARVV